MKAKTKKEEYKEYVKTLPVMEGAAILQMLDDIETEERQEKERCEKYEFAKGIAFGSGITATIIAFIALLFGF